MQFPHNFSQPEQQLPHHPQHRRKPKPNSSLSKLHRPLTRFYCNDCRKKFRSRILANRNNNAVQHYCAMYSKIITRKVEAHSNKCKADHGMGPCVVKRTDEDPESDGEDETKAAYYADKGKKPRNSTIRKNKLKSKTVNKKTRKNKKRKPEDYSIDGNLNSAKRQKLSNNNVIYDQLQPTYDGYYNQSGYMQPDQLNNHNGNNGHMYYHNPTGPTPMFPPPMESDLMPPQIMNDDYNGNYIEANCGPPPMLEELPINNNNNKKVEDDNEQQQEKAEQTMDDDYKIENDENNVLKVVDDRNGNAMLNIATDDDMPCINEETEDDEDDSNLNVSNNNNNDDDNINNNKVQQNGQQTKQTPGDNENNGNIDQNPQKDDEDDDDFDLNVPE